MIALACDHGGFALMKEVRAHLSGLGVDFKDFGTDSPDSCDYPVIAAPAARAVASGECQAGIFICGTGIGISVAANKVPGIRAALCTDAYTAEMARRHNNSNILCLGARVIGGGVALQLVDIFLNTPFDAGRHEKRVAQIAGLEAIDNG